MFHVNVIFSNFENDMFSRNDFRSNWKSPDGCILKVLSRAAPSELGGPPRQGRMLRKAQQHL
jgi:hypothetical protein